MKPTMSKVAMIFAITLLILSVCEQVSGVQSGSSSDELSSALAQRGRGRGGGGAQGGGPPGRGRGGSGNAAGSNRSNADGSGAGSIRPGGADVPSGRISLPVGDQPRGHRGGIHAPSISGSRRASGRTQLPSPGMRTPSFSLPRTGTPLDNLIRQNVDRALRDDGRMRNAGQAAPTDRPDLRNNLRDALTDDLNLRQDRDEFERRSRSGSRFFDGDTIRFNDQSFRLGGRDYVPPQYRHSRYHGHWNDRASGGYRRGSDWGWDWGFGRRYGRYGYGGGYGYRPLGWGLGGWGLGSLLYHSGYLGYWNPYYVQDPGLRYNYAYPVIVSYDSDYSADSNSAAAVLDEAVAAFQNQDYDAALDITNQGIDRFPDDAMLHEFRALVLFARRDYQQSAATIHAVLAVGPGWDWTTLSGMYVSVATYTDQLRSLERFVTDNPLDAPSRFLLSYHYLCCGHSDAAARQLRRVTELMPSDRLAADLLKMIEPPAAVAESAQIEQRAPERPNEAPAVSREQLTGSWTASREDGSTFRLELREDRTFTWHFQKPDQPDQEFSGTSSLEGNILVLQRSDGGALIAEITPESDSGFHFRLMGGDDADPGLQFHR